MFGIHLRATRVACGLSQAEMGEVLGISQSLESDYERGRRPTLREVPSLLTILDALDRLNDVDHAAASRIGS